MDKRLDDPSHADKEHEPRVLGGMTENEVERRLIAGELNEEILVAFKAHLLSPEGENDIQPMLGRLCDLAIEGLRARSAGTRTRDFAKAERVMDEYIADYEFRGDEGDHTPTEGERVLMKDCIMGLLAEDEFLSALSLQSASTSIQKPDAAVAVGGKSVQLSYFKDGERDAALAAFERWLA